MRNPHSSGYQRDLACIHDAGFTFDLHIAGPWLLKTFRHHGIRKGRVIDVGCGSGVWARMLTDAGFEVMGIDISPAMLSLARKRAPEARFVRGSFLEIPLPSCSAITALGEVVNYMFDPRNTSLGLDRFFRRVGHALPPGGVFIFDAALPGRAPQPYTRHVESKKKDWMIVVRVEEDARRPLLTRHMTMFRRVGKSFRRSEEVHRQRLYPKAEIVSRLERAGFKVFTLAGYRRAEFARGQAGFLCQKR